jgi:hypothetical protein
MVQSSVIIKSVPPTPVSRELARESAADEKL